MEVRVGQREGPNKVQERPKNVQQRARNMQERANKVQERPRFALGAGGDRQGKVGAELGRGQEQVTGEEGGRGRSEMAPE